MPFLVRPLRPLPTREDFISTCQHQSSDYHLLLVPLLLLELRWLMRHTHFPGRQTQDERLVGTGTNGRDDLVLAPLFRHPRPHTHSPALSRHTVRGLLRTTNTSGGDGRARVLTLLPWPHPHTHVTNLHTVKGLLRTQSISGKDGQLQVALMLLPWPCPHSHIPS